MSTTLPAGKKPKDAAAPARTEPTVAVAGTAEQAAQGAADAVVIGPAGGPVTEGGPGVGAAQLATETRAVETRPLTEADAADLGLRGPLNDVEREELARLRREAQARLVVDAADVPGIRYAQAATAIQHDGTYYAPDGEHRIIPVTYSEYVRLREIGAILNEPWESLNPAG